MEPGGLFTTRRWNLIHNRISNGLTSLWNTLRSDLVGQCVAIMLRPSCKCRRRIWCSDWLSCHMGFLVVPSQQFWLCQVSSFGCAKSAVLIVPSQQFWLYQVSSLDCAKSAVLNVPSQQFWFSMFRSLWCNATSLVCSEPRLLIRHRHEALNNHQTLFLMRGWGPGHKAISLWNAQQEFCASGYVHLLLTLVITTDWVLFETNLLWWLVRMIIAFS